MVLRKCKICKDLLRQFNYAKARENKKKSSKKKLKNKILSKIQNIKNYIKCY